MLAVQVYSTIILVEYGKEVILLKSSLSNLIFNDFTSSYQRMRTQENSSKPFVYVDPNGSVKYLTNFVDEADENDEIFAISVAEDGWMEFLALQEN